MNRLYSSFEVESSDVSKSWNKSSQWLSWINTEVENRCYFELHWPFGSGLLWKEAIIQGFGLDLSISYTCETCKEHENSLGVSRTKITRTHFRGIGKRPNRTIRTKMESWIKSSFGRKIRNTDTEKTSWPAGTRVKVAHKDRTRLMKLEGRRLGGLTNKPTKSKRIRKENCEYQRGPEEAVTGLNDIYDRWRRRKIVRYTENTSIHVQHRLRLTCGARAVFTRWTKIVFDP